MSSTVTNCHSDARYFHFLKTYKLFSNIHISYSVKPLSYYY